MSTFCVLICTSFVLFGECFNSLSFLIKLLWFLFFELYEFFKYVLSISHFRVLQVFSSNVGFSFHLIIASLEEWKYQYWWSPIIFLLISFFYSFKENFAETKFTIYFSKSFIYAKYVPKPLINDWNHLILLNPIYTMFFLCIHTYLHNTFSFERITLLFLFDIYKLAASLFLSFGDIIK